MPHKAGIGVITGIVTEDGVPKSKRVVLVDRSNLTIIARTQSDENGKYVFSGLNADTNDYLVFGVDDDIELKNAEIHDYIRPISGHQGATYPYNWLWLVLRKNPTNVWMGQTQGGDFVGYSLNKTEQGGIVLANQDSQTPYAPAFPMTELNVGKVINTGFTPATQTTDTTDNFTLECVIDLASDNLIIASSSGSSPYNSFYFYYSIIYKKGVLIIRYKRYNTSSFETIITHNTNTSGVAHIVAVFEFGNVARLFINGEEVAQGKITDTKLSTGEIRRLTILTANGVMDNFHHSKTGVAVGKIGCMAGYYAALSDEDILEHYQALFTETLPRLTGFVKEIFVDNPCHLYRLNESDIAKDGVVDYLTLSKQLTVNNAQAVLVNQPSVITGGNTVLLNGTHFTGSVPAFTISQDGFAFECVLRIDTDATAGQTLYSQSVDDIVIERLKTSGNIQVSYPLSGTTETVKFDPLPQGELLLLSIVIDKVNNKALLYLNGAVIEEQSITVVKIKLNNTNNNAVKNLIIGQNFIGCIGDVALYPTPLSAERIKAHYDARDIL